MDIRIWIALALLLVTNLAHVYYEFHLMNEMDDMTEDWSELCREINKAWSEKYRKCINERSE